MGLGVTVSPDIGIQVVDYDQQDIWRPRRFLSDRRLQAERQAKAGAEKPSRAHIPPRLNWPRRAFTDSFHSLSSASSSAAFSGSCA